MNRLDLTARVEGGKQPKTGVERAVAHAKRAEALALVVWRSEAQPVGTSLLQSPRAPPQPQQAPELLQLLSTESWRAQRSTEGEEHTAAAQLLRHGEAIEALAIMSGRNHADALVDLERSGASRSLMIWLENAIEEERLEERSATRLQGIWHRRNARIRLRKMLRSVYARYTDPYTKQSYYYNSVTGAVC